MTQTIYGLHDEGGEHLMTDAGVRGWVVYTHALRDGVTGYDYSGPHTPIARLNWGYYPHGTVPSGKPNIFYPTWEQFELSCAQWVRNSQGCHHWIIGNESNHEQEWPDGQRIDAHTYSRWYDFCRYRIRQCKGHEQDQVIPAAPAPWNASMGDWVDYWAEILNRIYGCDGLALHAYTHGHDANLIYDESTMGPPYQDRHYNWISYRDFLQAVPVHMRHLPVYITEADPDVSWHDENRGWVQAAYGDVDWFNKTGRFLPEYTDPTGKDAVARGVPCNPIHALCLYRWQTHEGDKWHFNDKPGVHDDFRAAMAKGYCEPA